MSNAREIKVLYCGEIAYLGEVDPNELKNLSNGVDIYNPFILNVRPITNKEQQDRLEAVVLDIMLPIEFAGIPLSEQFYTGFVNFLPTVLDIPGSKVQYMKTETGGRLAINKLASISDRSDPFLRLSVTKVATPCPDLVQIYKLKLASYNELLYSMRAIELQEMPSEDRKEPEPTRNTVGNVINFDKGNETVH